MATKFWRCYYECIWFSLSPKATSLMWPQFLGKLGSLIRGGLLYMYFSIFLRNIWYCDTDCSYVPRPKFTSGYASLPNGGGNSMSPHFCLQIYSAHWSILAARSSTYVLSLVTTRSTGRTLWVIYDLYDERDNLSLQAHYVYTRMGRYV